MIHVCVTGSLLKRLAITVCSIGLNLGSEKSIVNIHCVQGKFFPCVQNYKIWFWLTKPETLSLRNPCLIGSCEPSPPASLLVEGSCSLVSRFKPDQRRIREQIKIVFPCLDQCIVAPMLFSSPPHKDTGTCVIICLFSPEKGIFPVVS